MSRRVFACRVDTKTPAVVEEIAKRFGCIRIAEGGKLTGAVGQLLDRIAGGELRVTREPE